MAGSCKKKAGRSPVVRIGGFVIAPAGGALVLYQPWSPAERAAQESGGADGG
jgi:hypothetical protein